MSYQPTHLGILLEHDREQEFVDKLVEGLKMSRGNIRRAAHLLNVSRRHLYRYLDRANLWDAVAEARKAPRQDPLSKALREL